MTMMVITTMKSMRRRRRRRRMHSGNGTYRRWIITMNNIFRT